MSEPEPKYDGRMTHDAEGIEAKQRSTLEEIRRAQREARAAMRERLAENKILPFQSFNLPEDRP